MLLETTPERIPKRILVTISETNPEGLPKRLSQSAPHRTAPRQWRARAKAAPRLYVMLNEGN